MALYLSRRSSEWSLPADALAEILVKGLDGWRGELLAVCWCRFGEEKELNYGRWLVRLTDRQLKALWRDYGSLVGLGAQPELLADMERLAILLRDTELEPAWERPVGFRLVLEKWEPALERGFLGRIISTLDREAEDREETVERVGLQPIVVELVSRIVSSWTPPTGYIAGMHFSARVRELRVWVVDFLRRHGQLPAGRHKVKELGWIDFGHDSSPSVM
jgi:hypothetical protein